MQVTGFEDQALEVNDTPGDYLDVFRAIDHNLDVAETVFTRVSKRYLNGQLDGQISRKTDKEAFQIRPQWSTSSLVAVDCNSFNDDRCCTLVHNVVKDLVSLIKQRAAGKTVILIELLRATIRAVAPRDYLFELRQKWGLE